MKFKKPRPIKVLVHLLWYLAVLPMLAFAIPESVRVSSNNDDAEERVSDGDMSRGSSDLEFGHDGSTQQIVGMRFRSVDIPQGATINTAYIEFETDETDSGTTNLVIYGQADDDPNQFANNDNNISDDRTKTSDLSSVDWSPSAWSSVNELHQTPDISGIIQEIVDRGGWSAGNDLVIIVEPGAGCNSSSCQRTAESHNGESGSAPLLVIDYSDGVTGDTTLNGSLNVDNSFLAFISTDDSTEGTLIGSGNDWTTTVDIATTLSEGQNYYLHIYAEDAGGVAGFLGDFELTGTNHTFSNGLNTLNTDTTNWSVSTSGWSSYLTPTSYGVNGVAPWGTRAGVDASAEWIWSSDNDSDNINFFSTPIFVVSPSAPPEISSVDGSCVALTTVTIVFNEALEQSSAETVSNYQILTPAGNAVVINSATLSPINTVTLSLASSLNDLTTYSLTVNNVEDLEGDAIAGGSSASFSLSCGLNCITDSFAGPGSLSTSWSASSSNGTFGTPRIVDNGRLRLTDNSGQAATVATLLNQFPGSGNQIEIEFDYYGYGGTGADGIAVTFSDASIPPVPGSYGGALGYAQRNNGTDGFAGGWLGVGIDEYGNFANPNEGKSGGSGFEVDSIALRGSGSGGVGYPYLTSTGTLSPGIDQSGSTPNPGHRYRITIDHTMSGLEAYVTVERDIGAGFVEVIPRFDIYTVNPSQAAVPTDWVVSFTGSTGGATNIHEIGEFQVCAALPIDSYGSPDHYHISHSSPGVTCEASEVTITAHDAAHDVFNVTSNTDITVTTSPAVDSIINSPVTMLAGTSTVSFYLNESDVLSNIDIDVTDGTATDLDDGGTEDPPFNFLDTAFRFYADSVHTDTSPIGTQISGKPSNVAPDDQSLTLRAIRTNTDTGACEAALQGVTEVELAYECNNPSTCTASNLLTLVGDSSETISRNDDGASLGYVGVDLVFDANGEAPFYFSYFDAGEITLHARKTVAANSPEPAFELVGQSNDFVVRPFGFDLDFIGLREADWLDDGTLNGTGGNVSYAEDHDGSVYLAAGDDFDMTITAVNWESGDDLDEDGLPDDGANLTGNSTTFNYGAELSDSTLELTHSLIEPSGEYLGELSATSVDAGGASTSFSNGVASATLNWDEVGVIDILIRHNDYFGLTDENILGIASNVGRFIPDRFIVNKNDGAFAPACNNFSYVGQDFSYETMAAPSLVIQAVNVAGELTENYTFGSFQKLTATNLNIERDFPTEDSKLGSNGSEELEINTDTSVGVFDDPVVTDGEILYTFSSSDSFNYSKDDNSEVGAFDSDLVITINKIEDSDGVEEPNIPITPLLITPTPVNIRYGRFVMKNAFGPETDALAMEAYTEFLNDLGVYVLNEDDNCSDFSSIITLSPSGSGAENHDAIAVSDGSSNFTYESPLDDGEAGFLFSAPGSGEVGEIGVSIDLSTLPWLQFDWNGDGTLQNPPDTTALFGQYRGHDRIIYWREIQ